MKADTWKAVFAAMSPSPVFQAIAELAEQRVDHRRSATSGKQTRLHIAAEVQEAELAGRLSRESNSIL
jgi:hypothetical protein